MEHFLSSPDKIIIRKHRLELQILSRFSATHNIFTRFREANHWSCFLPVDKPFEAWEEGELFHEGWDDFAPFATQEYGYIGGNHGSPYALRVSMLRHWFDESDIGKVLRDDAGNRFVLLDVESSGNFIIHSEKSYSSDERFFRSSVSGSLYDGKRKLRTNSIKPIHMLQRNAVQLSPHDRYNRFELFVDGAPLPDDQICECSGAQLHWDIDLCPPEAQIEYLLAHPGKYVSPTAPELDAAINIDLKINFQPYSADVFNSKITFKRDFDLPLLYGLIQNYGAVGCSCQEKMIPKLKPFNYHSWFRAPEIIDLSRPWKVWKFPKTNCMLSREHCADPQEPPTEYIDFFGDGTTRKFAVVLGYSDSSGITAKNSTQRSDTVCCLPESGKIYPYALQRRSIRKGESFEINAYRQIFDPNASAATAAYGHDEADGYRFFAHYHSTCEDLLQLPRRLANRRFETVEQDGNISFPDGDTIAADGTLKVKVKDSGRFTLRIKD